MVGFKCFIRLLFPDAQTFWTAIAAISTIGAVVVALQPIREKARLGKALFYNAISIEIFPDGVFQIKNLFDEPIIIKSIAQELYRGSDLGINASNYKESTFRVDKKTSRDYKLHRLNKSFAPKQVFTFPQSKTHLPQDLEAEVVWLVKTKIRYESMTKVKKTLSLTHRFSYLKEPRLRWVEDLI